MSTGIISQMKRAINEKEFWEEVNACLPNDGEFHADYLTNEFDFSFVCNLHTAIATPGSKKYAPKPARPTMQLVREFYDRLGQQ